jgi:hypothetical protein
MARVVHAVDVEIQGELDPSLAKAVGLSVAELKRLESATKAFNSVMSKLNANLPRDVMAANDKINSSLDRMASHSSQAARKVQHDERVLEGEAGELAAV